MYAKERREQKNDMNSSLFLFFTNFKLFKIKVFSNHNLNSFTFKKFYIFQVQSLPIMKNPWQVYRRVGQTINKHNRLISDWARRHINDKYVRQSLKDGYRCRSAYKLLQIQEKYNLLEPG